jgi:hypothetical protein
MTNPIIFLGSSRNFGETRQTVEMIITDSNSPIINLSALQSSPYDYQHNIIIKMMFICP